MGPREASMAATAAASWVGIGPAGRKQVISLERQLRGRVDLASRCFDYLCSDSVRYFLSRHKRFTSRNSAPDKSRPAASDQKNRVDHVRARLGALFSFVIVAALALALWQSRDFGFRAGLFPWVIGTPLLILAVGQLVLDLTGKTKFKSEDIGAGAELPQELVYKRTMSICAWTIGYFIAIWLLGFSLAVPLTTLLYLKVAGREKWPIALTLSLIAWGFFYGLFEYGLHIPFPDPVLKIPFLN